MGRQLAVQIGALGEAAHVVSTKGRRGRHRRWQTPNQYAFAKALAIQELEREHPYRQWYVHELCKKLECSKTAFYRWEQEFADTVLIDGVARFKDHS